MQFFNFNLCILLVAQEIIYSEGFSPQLVNLVHGRNPYNANTIAFSRGVVNLNSTPNDIEQSNQSLEKQIIEQNSNDNDDNNDGPMVVSSPLKFIGTYPSLSLHFPNLATSNQREKDISGIALDFILDTAANTNTINYQVAKELSLDTVGNALPGYNAGGEMDVSSSSDGDVAQIYNLGDTILDIPEMRKNEEIFMKGLYASALPVASPAAAGLLGVSFLNCFEGGVKFDWNVGADANVGNEMEKKSMVTFYGDKDGMEEELAGMKRVPIDVIKDILLPSVTLKINGKEVRALLDTGSPITVLNSAAAKLVGIDNDIIQLPSTDEGEQEEGGGFKNPFKKMMDSVKNANVYAQAASSGDVLVLAGGEGQAIQLLRTQNVVKSLSLQGDEEKDDGDVEFTQSKIYVGDLPGLAALGGLDGINSPPAAILGMDILTQKSSMLYRVNEVYFS